MDMECTCWTAEMNRLRTVVYNLPILHVGACKKFPILLICGCQAEQGTPEEIKSHVLECSKAATDEST